MIEMKVGVMQLLSFKMENGVINQEMPAALRSQKRQETSPEPLERSSPVYTFIFT